MASTPRTPKKEEKQKPILLKPEEYLEKSDTKSPQKVLVNPDFNCVWSSGTSSREDDVIEVQGPSSTPIDIPGNFKILVLYFFQFSRSYLQNWLPLNL